MKDRGIVGILLLAVGGTLLLDSLGYVMRIAIDLRENFIWFSIATLTAFIALLLVGLGLHFIIESAQATAEMKQD